MIRIAREVALGFVVNTVGVGAWIACITLVPAPWSILAMAFLLVLYWWYFSGNGWPASTVAARRTRFRPVRLGGEVWRYALPAALLFVVTVQSGLVVTFRIIQYPAELFMSEYKLGDAPVWMAWLFVVMASLVAGICEEVGFRGYMQVPLEGTYGPQVAIPIVSLVFVVVHLHQAWAWPILFQIFAVSVLLGLLAWASNSLLPSILAHTLLDIVNFSYWWSDLAGRFTHRPIGETGLDAHFILTTATLAMSLGLFFAALYRVHASRRSHARLANNSSVRAVNS